MTGAFPFLERFDDDPVPVVRGLRRWHGPARAGQATLFCYPRLEPPQSAAAAVPPPAPPPAYNAEELAAAVAAARRDAGTEAAAAVHAEMQASLEHRTAAALAALGAQLAACREALERTLAARAAASRDLALAIGRALVGEALARQPLADVEAMFRELVVRLEGEPWLEIRLPPELTAAAEKSLLAIAEEAGYRGALRVLPEPRLGPGDARLSWQDGVAERDLAALEAEAVALVDTWLAEPRQARSAESEA